MKLSFCLKGRLIVAGLAAKQFDPKESAQTGSFSVTGITLRDYRRENHDLYR